ncbi:alpha/beta hydrolase family protein [Roseibium sp.]|uniref:alpha/beta hydrolase family protein n=1 Tax=Roseibium sp. TaxID=1936156 RepID=UPI003D0C0B01
MKLRVLLAALSLATAQAVPAFATEGVGVRELRIHSDARDIDLTVLVWYPAHPGGEPVLVGDDRIFEGTPAHRGAPPVAAPHPLILLSHGSGASVQKMAWIATALAAKGFVVAGPNHPGTTSGDSTPEDTPKLWERTDDLATVLSTLSADPDWTRAIDPNKVGLLGFSLGGSAVLETAGATASLDAYVSYCETYPQMPDCRWFAGGRAYIGGEEFAVEAYDLRRVDRARFEEGKRDPRISAVVAVDPGLATAFEAGSIARIGIPLHFINLGQPETIPVGVSSDRLAEAAPNAKLDRVRGAVHFSFLPVCKPSAAAFMKSVGETDTLCEDGGDRPRAELHAELTDMIVRSFEQSLGRDR